MLEQKAIFVLPPLTKAQFDLLDEALRRSEYYLVNIPARSAACHQLRDYLTCCVREVTRGDITVLVWPDKKD